MQLKKGTLLQGGKYKIERVLGQGGFGITYLAVHTMLGSKVAVKEFYFKDCCERVEGETKVSVPTKSNLDIVERFKSKFIKEAQTVFQMKHDNIVRIFDIFEENRTAYYVMEYIDGGSLHDIIKKEGKIPEARVLKYTKQIANALRYIHENNVLHLDIKPANILLRNDDSIVLIDFGVSKRYDASGGQTSTTPAGISKGYAPLEQYKQGGLQSFAPCTDVYSLGATMYKMLTGTTPPEASDVAEDGLPPLPSAISWKMRKAIEKAMNPRRKDRPQSMAAFVTLLPTVVVDVEPEPEEIVPNDVDSEETRIDTSFRQEQDTDEYTYLDDEEDNGTKKKIIVAAIVILAIIVGWFMFGGNKTDKSYEDNDSIFAEDSVMLENENEEVSSIQTNTKEERNDGTKSIRQNDISDYDISTQPAESHSTTTISEPAPPVLEENKVFDVVEQMPSFPGGTAALMQYLGANIKYPAVAEENGIQGRVICTFVVEKNGAISDVRVAKSVDPSLDKEAVRVVSSMPRWISGKQNGSTVRVKYTLPVTFRLQ